MVAISIVIPAYQCAAFVGAAVAGVRAQSASGWECVVVDDGSDDGTGDRALAAAGGDPRFRVVRQANAGVSAARNTGLALATGRSVLFLDADDRLHPDAVERLHAGLAGSPAVAAFGSMLKILADGRVQPGQKPPARHRHPSGDVLEAMLTWGFLNVGQVLIRTDAARRAGGFRPELRLSEDWEFLCRLACEGGFRFVDPDPPVLFHRLSPGTATRSLAAGWENHEPFLAAVEGNPAYARILGRRRWEALHRHLRASVLWEVGRVNFCERRFDEARRRMLASLRLRPGAKRAALFALAEASRRLDRPLVNRLRFTDLDRVPTGDPAR